MKVFLDANVLFTASHNPDGKSAFIIQLGTENDWKVLTCELALQEAERNIQLKIPHALKELKRLKKLLVIVPTVIHGKSPIALPDKDIPIFLSAQKAKCSHLLTGDLKHFGPHMNKPDKSAGIHIQTVSDFLKQWV